MKFNILLVALGSLNGILGEINNITTAPGRNVKNGRIATGKLLDSEPLVNPSFESDSESEFVKNNTKFFSSITDPTLKYNFSDPKIFEGQKFPYQKPDGLSQDQFTFYLCLFNRLFNSPYVPSSREYFKRFENDPRLNKKARYLQKHKLNYVKIWDLLSSGNDGTLEYSMLTFNHSLERQNINQYYLSLFRIMRLSKTFKFGVAISKYQDYKNVSKVLFTFIIDTYEGKETKSKDQ